MLIDLTADELRLIDDDFVDMIELNVQAALYETDPQVKADIDRANKRRVVILQKIKAAMVLADEWKG